MKSKYDVASFADVFCKPFYWQSYHLLKEAPSLVVDAGANCGHFTLLAHRCIATKFPKAAPPQTILVEPNPHLEETIRRNLRDNGLSDCAQLVPGLLGVDAEQTTLWINTTNYLLSSFKQFDGAKPYQVRRALLRELTGDRRVDLMKMDIEGGEFGLVANEPDVFERVNVLLMEAHGTPAQRADLIARLGDCGLSLAADPIPDHDNELLAFTRVA